MTIKPTFAIVCLAALMGAGAALAETQAPNQDAKAIEVLKSMSAYTDSLDRTVIKAVNLTDARLEAGLMVTNSVEVTVSIDRPGSLRISSFDGVDAKELVFHEGLLTVFSSDRGFYAQASIPKEIEAAMEFALEELEVEAPMMDLIYRDASTHLIGSDETILYLADKTRVAGVDCHHLAIRGTDVDVQMWVEEGDRPVPRKIVITSKWEGGAPRFTANMLWDSEPQFEADFFDFKPPEGAIDVGFAVEHKQGGE
jgi:hypothetical protein